MKIKRKLLALVLSMVMVLCLGLAGCKSEDKETTGDTTSEADSTKDETTDGEVSGEEEMISVPDTDEYIKLALNVYFNDGDNGYYSNEAGQSIYVTGEGQYTLSFDCAKDLSDKAVSAGVNSLTNLTAIYILDMESADGEQSPLKGCNIMYDAVVVDGTELTITQTEPKSAFKASGIFDTNDPINAWDGSYVEEVNSTSDHVANFTTVKNPTTISVTFTLSDFDWVGKEQAAEEVVSANEYVNTAKFSDMDLASMDALTLSKYLGNGINLGNTMEAYGHATLGAAATVSSYETYWGQPETTAEMIMGMKNCGFDTIRIPISWTNMMDYENGNYTIDTAYLDRVEEIVNYALDAEMFVIINDHWDGAWWGKFGSSTEATRQEAWTIYESIWTQVAERFADYPDMLIFESANEELGDSLNANTVCTDSGSLSEDECYETANAINQKFIDIVRSSGGNNANRFLLIAGYNTDITLTCDDRYKMPADTVEGKLFISVHYYTPWNYCGAENQSRWGTKADYAQMDELLAMMTKYTQMGYGVIIGEYAALPIYDNDTATSTLKENTAEFTSYFLDNCDIYNYCPVLWSCNDFYNKRALNMITDEMTELFTSRCYAEESALDGYIEDVREHMNTAVAEAPEQWEGVVTYEPGTPVAWIMWNGGAGTYSVGDIYNPSDNTEGITAHDVVVDGPGEYEVSLDFAGENNGLTFAALALADGELLYPGAILDIKEITVDGEKLKQVADDYTSSDDGKCTRVNLYNTWVKNLPDDARNVSGHLENAKPVIIDAADMVGIKNITIKFELVIGD